MLAVRASLLAVFALISCALAIGLARAQEPAAETGTILHPGLNLVGWVAEPTSVSRLFREIPQLEAVWAWDAELDEWIVAAPGAPEWLGGLGRVQAGMGLCMQLGGDQPYLWQRSTEPTRGLVKLRTGWNLVAWSGADQTPIDDALKGVGWSLRVVHRWNPATQQWTTWTSPERTAQLIAANNTDQEADDDNEMPTIRRGEALWINVARAVNWLQPTDILPRLVFPGGASQHLQTRVREDLEAVLNFFRTQYGIQAEPDFTIYAAKDADALIQAYRDDGDEIDDEWAASIRARWGVGGWAGDDRIVVRSDFWPESPSSQITTHSPSGFSYTNYGRYIITHEYFHILQFQLDPDSWGSAAWLVEGTASWIDDEHKVFDGELTWGDLRDGVLWQITDDTPTLRSTEFGSSDRSHYDLGWFATDRLIADGEPDSAIEFWRRLLRSTDWETAFREVSGQPVSEFYAAFDAWQRTAAGYDGNWIRGKVVFASGAAASGVFLISRRVEGEISVGRSDSAETADDGSFAMRAPEAGDYILSVHGNQGGCSRYYSDGQLVDRRAEARPVKVSQSDVSIDIRLPPDVCGWPGLWR